jgi:hypothetical protein
MTSRQRVTCAKSSERSARKMKKVFLVERAFFQKALFLFL